MQRSPWQKWKCYWILGYCIFGKNTIGISWKNAGEEEDNKVNLGI
jgi:hypothetical protein